MKVFYAKWHKISLMDFQVVLINAKTPKEARDKFDKFIKTLPEEERPGAWSPREVVFKDCIYLNEIR